MEEVKPATDETPKEVREILSSFPRAGALCGCLVLVLRQHDVAIAREEIAGYEALDHGY